MTLSEMILSNSVPLSRLRVTMSLRSLLAQNFRRESMGTAGRNRAPSRFAWHRIAQDSLNICQGLGSHDRALEELQSAALR